MEFSGGVADRADDSKELAHYLRATKLLPLDGVVGATAREITPTARNDQEKARAIYDWIVENTYRNSATRGCGLGNKGVRCSSQPAWPSRCIAR